MGHHVEIDDTRLWVEERGGGEPLFILHGGPGLDHRMFGDYLDALGDRHRLLLVDQRSQGRSDRTPPDTWTLARLARDVSELARALDLETTRSWAIPSAPSSRSSTPSTSRARPSGPSSRPASRRRASWPPSRASSRASSPRSSASRWRAPGRARRRCGPRRSALACSPSSCRSTSRTRAIRASPSTRRGRRAPCTLPTSCATRRRRTTARSRWRTAWPRSPSRCWCWWGATSAPARWRPPRRSPRASPTPSSWCSSTART